MAKQNAEPTQQGTEEKILDTVLGHQKQIADVTAQIQTLEQAAADHESRAGQARSAVPSFDHLYRQREDLLADIAVGAAPQKRLAELDERILNEKEGAKELIQSAGELTRHSEQVVTGINRRLDEKRDELAKLNAATERLLRQLVKSEANDICCEYVSAALRVKDLFQKIIGLDVLLADKLGGGNIRGFGWHETFLPVFALPACDGVGHPNWPGMLWAAKFLTRDESLDAMREQIARLYALGVQL